MSTLKFSLLTGAQDLVGNTLPVTKMIELFSDGTLSKQSLAHHITGGTCQQYEVTFEQFAQGLPQLTPSNAILYGTSNDMFNRIITQNSEQNGFSNIGDISRTNQNFHYPSGPSIFFGDLDGDANNPAPDLNAQLQMLGKVHPDFLTVPVISRPSTSSCIYNSSNGQELVGINGYRLYFPVTLGTLIPKLGDLIHQHLWLLGYCNYKISKSGRFLDRGPFDTSVWQPSRIDYNGGAYCIPPLVQKLPAPIILNENEEFLDIEKVIDEIKLTPSQLIQLESIKAQQKQLLLPQSQAIRAQWMQNNTQKLVTNRGLLQSDAQAILNPAVNENNLLGNYEIFLDNSVTVTVDQILLNPETYNGIYCADPIEPDYRNHDTKVARIWCVRGKTPHIWSFAHGGSRYNLGKIRKEVILRNGSRSTAVDEIADIMVKQDYYYRYNGLLVRANDGHLKEIKEADLTYELGHLIDCKKEKFNLKTGTFEYINTEVPDKVCHLLLNVDKLKLPKLNGIITAPTMRLDGSILDKPGFDPLTGLLLTLPDGIDISIPENPDLETVINALNYVWYPFKDFPFDTSLDRTVYFAALLTTVIRKILPLAPMFLIDGPIAGCGKSKLTESLCYLMIDKKPNPIPFNPNKDELQKTILTVLSNGSHYINFDNIQNGSAFGSPLFDMFLTTQEMEGRKLGSNDMLKGSTRLLFVVNGNNITLSGDIHRRALFSRLNPRVENPEQQVFAFDPVDYVKENRLDIVRALLIILRGFIIHGLGKVSNNGIAVGSFTDWDRLVRGAILWLMTLTNCPIELTDPAEGFAKNKAHKMNDNTGEILSSIYKLHGSNSFQSRGIYKDLFSNSGTLSPDQELLRDLFSDSLGTSKKGVTSKSIGDWFGSKVDVIKKGYTLNKLPTLSGGSFQWTITCNNQVQSNVPTFQTPSTQLTQLTQSTQSVPQFDNSFIDNLLNLTSPINSSSPNDSEINEEVESDFDDYNFKDNYED